MAKGKDKKSNEGTCKKICRGCCALARGLCGASVVTYFLYSAIMYLVCGGLSLALRGSAQTLLCTIPGLYNESVGQEVGCGNCTDQLLMCNKMWCYKAAMNITILKLDSGRHEAWRGAFEDATQDTVCNYAVSEAIDPVGLLKSVIDTRADTPGTPSDACVDWHCHVMLQATIESSDLVSVSNVCTNVHGAKPDYFANTCICSALTIDAQTAGLLADNCGPTAQLLQNQMFIQAVNQKDVCFQTTTKIAGDLFPTEWQNSQKNSLCATWLQQASTHWAWFTSYEQFTSGTMPQGVTANTFSSCVTIFCAAFVQALNLSTPLTTCSWTAEDYVPFNAGAAWKIVKTCELKPLTVPSMTTASSIAQLICNKSTDPQICLDCPGNNTLRVCPPAPAPAPAVTAVASAAARRLELADEPVERQHSGDDEPTLQASTSDAQLSSSRMALTIAEDSGAVSTLVVKPKNLYQRYLHHTYRHVPVPSDEEPFTFWTSIDRGKRERKLQSSGSSNTGSSAAELNDNLPDYTTGSWSQCVCFQQCMVGVKKRSVSCSSSACKSPMPETQQQCQCTHCAACDVIFSLLLFALTLLIQGVSALLLCGAFFYAATVEEDDLADDRCCTWVCPCGCLCKWFPLLARFLVYFNLFHLIFLAVQAFVPVLPGEPRFDYDCKANSPFQFLVIVNAVFWVVQLGYGIYMKKYKPLPPQLHIGRSSNKFIASICLPLKGIGP